MRGELLATEHQEQVVVIDWFDMQYPALAGRLFAVPNGGHRHKAVAAQLKAEGVRAGVPDLWLPIPCHGFHGLIIEMKRRRGGQASTEQTGWLNFLDVHGYLAVLCAGADPAMQTIKDYLREYRPNRQDARSRGPGLATPGLHQAGASQPVEGAHRQEARAEGGGRADRRNGASVESTNNVDGRG